MRFPAGRERDPHFGLSRGWFYKNAALGRIKLITVKDPGASKGVSFIDVASVLSYLASCADQEGQKAADVSSAVARRRELRSRKKGVRP